MTRWTRLAFAVYLIALGLWAGSLMMTAVTAAVAFPTVKALDPVVPALDPASRPHWPLIAGKVASNVFVISHMTQSVCALLVIGAGVALCRVPSLRMRRSPSSIAACLAVATLGWYLLILWPRMRANLYTYWDNLFAGRLEPAAAAQRAFNADHPTSSTTMAIIFVLVLTALITGAWKATAPAELAL
jgi:Ca2+/H+ antiporter